MKAKNGDLHREPFLDVFKILNSLDQCKFIYLTGAKLRLLSITHKYYSSIFVFLPYSIVNVHKTGQWSEGYRWFCVSVMTP